MQTTAEGATGRRLALVVATGSYVDPTLAKLRAPGQDASDLAAVLKDAGVGGFDVEMVLDAPAELLRRRVAQFCAQIGPGDLALVYLSCHGVLDDRGRLYYATVDTDRALLSATAVSSAWLNEQLEDCRSRRQILVLDCCHSGAFAKGAKGEGSLALRERFEGRGRVILTGSRATEYSFERGRVVGDSVSSVFTSALVEGLRSGDADRNGDGMITVSELYDYAYETVRARETRQTPTLWSYGSEGDLLIAQSPRGTVVKPAPLPEELIALLESARPRVRASAVTELTELLRGPDASRALTARTQLERVATEDVPSVAEAARAALDATPVTAQPLLPRATHGLPSRPSAAGSSAPSGPPPLRRHRMLMVVVVAVLLAAVALAVALRGGGAGHSPGPNEIAVRGSPQGVAVDESAIWVTSPGLQRVSRIERSSDKQRPSKVPPEPGKIVAGEDSVWVGVRKGTGLVRIDPGSFQVGAEVPVDINGQVRALDELAISRGLLWIGSADGQAIASFDLHTGTKRDEYDAGPGFTGVFAMGGGSIWAIATNGLGASWVRRIDLSTHDVTPIPLRPDSAPSGIAFGMGLVWVADSSDKYNAVTVIEPVDPKHSRIIKNIKVDAGINYDDIAVVDGAVLVWSPGGGVLTRINATSKTEVGNYLVPYYETDQPENTASSDLTVDGDFAWVSDPVGDFVYKVNWRSIHRST